MPAQPAGEEPTSRLVATSRLRGWPPGPRQMAVWHIDWCLCPLDTLGAHEGCDRTRRLRRGGVRLVETERSLSDQQNCARRRVTWMRYAVCRSCTRAMKPRYSRQALRARNVLLSAEAGGDPA